MLSIRHGRILGSRSCGLVCVETDKNESQIRNPITGKSLQLPPLERSLNAGEMRVYPNPRSRQFDVVASYDIYYLASFTIGVDSEWR